MTPEWQLKVTDLGAHARRPVRPAVDSVSARFGSRRDPGRLAPRVPAGRFLCASRSARRAAVAAVQAWTLALVAAPASAQQAAETVPLPWQLRTGLEPELVSTLLWLCESRETAATKKDGRTGEHAVATALPLACRAWLLALYAGAFLPEKWAETAVQEPLDAPAFAAAAGVASFPPSDAGDDCGGAYGSASPPPGVALARSAAASNATVVQAGASPNADPRGRDSVGTAGTAAHGKQPVAAPFAPAQERDGVRDGSRAGRDTPQRMPAVPPATATSTLADAGISPNPVVAARQASLLEQALPRPKSCDHPAATSALRASSPAPEQRPTAAAPTVPSPRHDLLPGAPGTPVALRTNLRPLAADVVLYWSAPTSGARAASFTVQRCTGVGCVNFADIATGLTSPQFTHANVMPYVVYRYRIGAANAAGISIGEPVSIMP